MITADVLWEQRERARLYYSTLMKITMGTVEKQANCYPWETEEWERRSPELCEFLSNPENDYGEGQEEYDVIMAQYYTYANTIKWLHRDLFYYANKDLTKYLGKPPISKAWLYVGLISAFCGALVGALLF